MVSIVTLPEAAALLGQSLHQVRYLIRSARLPAKKVGGQCRVRREDLPRGDAQAQAAKRKVERLREAVDDALALPSNKARRCSAEYLSGTPAQRCGPAPRAQRKPPPLT